MNTGSLVNLLTANTPNTVKPEPGVGATLLSWTDRHAGTIERVEGKRLWWKRDTATRTDSNGMSESQAYTFERNPDASEQLFTLRPNGRWVQKGSPMKSGCCLSIGHRSQYFDYSF